MWSFTGALFIHQHIKLFHFLTQRLNQVLVVISLTYIHGLLYSCITQVSNCPRHRSHSTFTYIPIITVLTKHALSVGLHIILHPDIYSLFVTTFSLILQLSDIFATTTCFLILRSSFICTITLLVSVISLLSNVLTCYL